LTSIPNNSIVISPVGNIDPDIVERIGKEIKRVFHFPAVIAPVLSDVVFAYDENRDQYHSTKILDRLSERMPENALKLIAVVDVDLFIPILTHVFGEAKLGGRTCVISLHRLKEDLAFTAHNPTYHYRIIKEAVHEFGHCFNLRHCRDHTCIMNYCRSIQDVDRRSDQLCRYCRVLLGDEMKRLGKQEAETKP